METCEIKLEDLSLKLEDFINWCIAINLQPDLTWKLKMEKVQSLHSLFLAVIILIRLVHVEVKITCPLMCSKLVKPTMVNVYFNIDKGREIIDITYRWYWCQIFWIRLQTQLHMCIVFMRIFKVSTFFFFFTKFWNGTIRNGC